MGLALRMLAAGRRVVVVQFLKDGESGEARLLAEHFGVPVFAGKVSDKFTWSMTSEELAATCELHDGNLASALAELGGAQEGLLVLDEALDALSKGLVDEALVDRALDMSARGVEVALTGRAPGEGRLHNRDAVRETPLLSGDMCKGRSGVLDGFQGDGARRHRAAQLRDHHRASGGP